MQAKHRMYTLKVQSKIDGVKNSIEYRWLTSISTSSCLELRIVTYERLQAVVLNAINSYKINES